MCRLYGFLASAPTKVDCTLVRAQNALLAQSRSDEHGLANPDGWGIGFYLDGKPSVEKRDTAAYEDLHFSAAAARVSARAVVAHVRRATVGRPAPNNTHPFSWGRWTFAHNGTVSAFARVAPELERATDPDLLVARAGTTDSELLFLWLLAELRRAGIDLERSEGETLRLGRWVGESIRRIDRLCSRQEGAEPAALNILLTDGVGLVGVRWGRSLHWLERAGVRDCEVCGHCHAPTEAGDGYRAVVVASERISGESWREVPERSLLSVDGSLRVEIEGL